MNGRQEMEITVLWRELESWKISSMGNCPSKSRESKAASFIVRFQKDQMKGKATDVLSE